jgi:mRNA-degrading endonuclease YafQ of YafQ-DinJ toxin-antitoxin module
LKREPNGKHRALLAKEFTQIVKLLVLDALLPENHRDHALTGN